MELIGQRFGHIRVTDVVGQGGMGDVYGGYDEKLERRVALKALAPEQRLDAEARERLLREARALSKLDHPNICRIHDYIESKEADLLILEFIDGKTLGDLMATSMPRAEKLRICKAVASVLVAAHRAGIVHRDLKPENVMLTKTGEVKVLDFGLARWLQRARTQSSTQQMPAPPVVLAKPSDVTAYLPRELESGPMETAAGIAMGTPLYMSPEQARGEVLTPASDMFSFGLLMQALFTGNDPHPTGLSARDVILRVALGETNAVEGVPGDVAALINRLKQFAPADRPTAVEAVERLQFIIEKPQRIARRGAAAAVAALLAFGGWRYTVDLQTERTKALDAQADAERRRAQAEDLIEFMLGDLHQKLKPVGRTDVLDDAAKRALLYIDSSKPEAMSSDDLLRSWKGLNQIGTVRVEQGNLSDALAAYTRSLSHARFVVMRSPESAEGQLAVATSHFYIGDVYRNQGKLEEALQHYTMYMKGAERLAAAHPDSDEYQLERAYGHSAVASIYERQRLYGRALEHLALTRTVKEARLKAKPDDLERQADVARTLNRIGYTLRRAGDLSGARQYYDREFAIYASLSEADPLNAQWKDRLVTSHNFLGQVAEMTGDIEATVFHRKEELELSRLLSSRDPGNARWQRNLAMVQMHHSNALRYVGNLDEARSSIAEAQRTMEDLVARPDGIESWRRDLAMTRVSAARLHLATGAPQAAERAAADAVVLMEPLLKMDAEMPRSTAEAYVTLGDARATRGQAAAARESWSRAAALLAPLDPKDAMPEAMDTMTRALIHLGRDDEARPLTQRLAQIGYRGPDYVRATSARNQAPTRQKGR